MEPATPALPDQDLAPIAASQRIEALDVVRGFALLGIFLMNIEYFNRTISSLGQGMPRGLTGIDWFASWFIAYFVQGKFWTIFSLLFGMGFAVMMTRAARAGRNFKVVYLRRVLALAVFGAAHFVLLWEGDILFSYAVGALMLMIVLYGKTRFILIGIAVAIGLAFIPGLGSVVAVAIGFAAAGLLAIYLRSGKRVNIRGRGVPLFSFLLLAIGALVTVAAAVVWLVPNAVEPRLPLSVFGPLVLIAGWLSWKYYEPVEKRSVRLALSVYFLLGIVTIAGGLIQRFSPDPDAVAQAATSAPEADKTGEEKTRHELAAERKAEREKRLAEAKAEDEKELQILTSGTYWDAVEWRGGRFPEKVADDFGFAIVLIGMFLLGTWFVRSGVMEDTGRHLPFFRKLSVYGLPAGIGLGLLGSSIAMSHTPGDRYDGWGIAAGLSLVGNLPACLGYVGMIVVMLHSRTVFSRVRVLGPAGRMALTNYLTQSLICTIYFYGYALGHWGMPRAQQALFVLVVYAAQIAFSHWWLSRFQYGPMEWLWRAFTYWHVSRLRRAEK
jgi:uncharacterized membrane protein YeiB